MRVLIVAETFLPARNGVTNSVLRVIEHLRRRGHDPLVVAPAPGPSSVDDTPVERIPAIEVPFYRSLSVGMATEARLEQIIERFRPDVVHLAAPLVLGARAATVARRMGVPRVGVYQTDVAGFATHYHLGFLGRAAWTWLGRVHGSCDLTLAPSTHAAWELRRHGIDRVRIWGRGVDHRRFDPGFRDDEWRRRVLAGRDFLVGSVGRLAPEKRLHLLAPLLDLDGVRVVIAGDGPIRRQLRRQLPGAVFTGHLSGGDLSRAFASLDVFVHAGADETFCQSIQEALASGVPVVAPASGGPVDLVAHGRTGFLYPHDEPKMMAGAVETLLADTVERSAMARRAQASVAHRTWEVVGDQLIGHYESVVGLTRSVRRAA
ncbi:MAG: glycosyltransferase family 1 protein [Acidimicrobiales bacterium]